GGSIILNREGITLVGDVYIEGELVMEEEEMEGVDVFSTQINRPDLPHMKVKFLLSPHSKKPMIGMPYTLLADGNEVKKGMTNRAGEVEIPHEEGTKQYEIRFANGAVYSVPMEEKFEQDTNKDELINEGFYPSSGDSPLATAKIYSALVKRFWKGK
ncbi:type IV secretion protein Rhs, partial [Aggregatibacter actinomycetemcomitans serotype d str. SA3033]